MVVTRCVTACCTRGQWLYERVNWPPWWLYHRVRAVRPCSLWPYAVAPPGSEECGCLGCAPCLNLSLDCLLGISGGGSPNMGSVDAAPACGVCLLTKFVSAR